MGSYWNKYLTDDSLLKFGGDRKSVEELTESLNYLKESKTSMAHMNVFNNNPHKPIVNDNMRDDEWQYGDNIQW